MNLPEIKEILPFLRAQGVSKFEVTDFKVEFHAGMTPAEAEKEATKTVEAVKTAEAALPPDLRTSEIMDQDKIMNWSAPPSPGDGPEMPLTGEGEA